MPMEFEWDEAKRLKNIEKHGLDFRDVDLVFSGNLAIVPSTHSGQEVRFLATGMLAGRFVTVVYTLRGEAHRIISFRRARDAEKTRYQALHG